MVPDYQILMLPTLQSASSGEISIGDAIDKIINDLGLTEVDRNERKRAGLVYYTRRGHYALTKEGEKIVKNPPEKIDNDFLAQYEDFQDFRGRQGQNNKQEIPVIRDSNVTPDEELRIAHENIKEALSLELIDRIRCSEPAFFEELIVKLLIAMGYGGTSEDAGRALGGSGDGGIDGVIDQDPLGVDQIYIQAKRYAEGNNIGSGAVRDFFGALNLKKAQKGIFFTTSSFSKSAIQTAENLSVRIVLIDKFKLADLMIQYNIGCRDEDVLYIKKIDEDFFDNL